MIANDREYSLAKLDGVPRRMVRAELVTKVARLHDRKPDAAAALENLLDDLLRSVG